MSTEPPDAMTPAQRKALTDAWDLLTEHFERVLVVLDFERVGPDQELENAHEGYWHGGAMAGIGLARFAEDRILHSSKKPDEEPG